MRLHRVEILGLTSKCTRLDRGAREPIVDHAPNVAKIIPTRGGSRLMCHVLFAGWLHRLGSDRAGLPPTSAELFWLGGFFSFTAQIQRRRSAQSCSKVVSAREIVADFVAFPASKNRPPVCREIQRPETHRPRLGARQPTASPGIDRTRSEARRLSLFLSRPGKFVGDPSPEIDRRWTLHRED